MNQITSVTLIIFKIIASVFIFKLTFTIVGLIALILQPFSVAIWSLGLLAMAHLVPDFWKTNNELWPVIWKGFICWFIWWVLYYFICGMAFGLDVIV